MVAHVYRGDSPVAEITYRPGLFVEVRVAKGFQDERIEVCLKHSSNGSLAGTWEEALDRYFNEGVFDSRDVVFPGELARWGSAKEHKSLFRKASFALKKDLEPCGYSVDIEFL